MPGIVTALTVNLSTLERQVELVHIERSIFGTTNDGIALFDLKVTGSSSGYVSSPKSLEEINASLNKSLSYNYDAKQTFNVPERINEPIAKFFERLFDDTKNLSQRFHRCAIIAWKNIGESDVNCFLEVKKVRDRLSHGEHVEESEMPVEKVKKLALKLLVQTKPIKRL